MDPTRFDALSRLVARSGNRRGVLKATLGALLGGGVATQAASTADARTRAPNGTPCASPRDCASGLCVDGVCCAGPCMETCAACNVAGLEGTCSPVSGAPVGNRGTCPGDGGVCSGACDGVTTAYCAGVPSGETACGPSTCANGWQSSQVCSGSGACVATSASCGIYACAPDGISCLGSCASDDDCIGTSHCANGICQGDWLLGSACDRPDQCQSGLCTDGVCCNQSCDGACQSCGADGFCADDPDDSACEAGVCCNGDCIALGTDSNCLACGDRCAGGETCCEDGCTELGTTENCLGCDDLCGGGDECNDPMCASGGCTTTPSNEGGDCDGGEGICVSGVCEPNLCIAPALGTSQCSSDGDCDTGETCLNGGCFRLCETCPQDCTNCRCLSATPDSPSYVCHDNGFYVGPCDTSADCPVGSICNQGSADGTGRHLCFRACPKLAPPS